MNLILAEHAGFCFGVKRALNLLEGALNQKKPIYTLGPLIHNPQVVEYFKKRGVKVVENLSQINKQNAVIVFRTHGVSPEIFSEARERGLSIIDATCPFVKRVQKKARQLLRQGYQVIIVGDPLHPEVQAINSWCENKAKIVNNQADLNNLHFCDKLGVVSQTTTNKDIWAKIVEDLKQKFPEAKTFNTICNATSQRQKAAKELASAVDLMIVIGGYNSSNTRKLAELCKNIGTKTYHIEEAKELDPAWLKKAKNVGITAGASTPDWIIKEVISKMKEISEKDLMEHETPQGGENLNKEEAVTGQNQDLKEKYEETFVTLKPGEVITGTVVQVNENEVMVNVGYKSDGIIPLHELSAESFASPEEIVKNGDKIDVYVLKIEDKEGNLILSKKRADIKKAWDEIENIYQNKDEIEAEVTEQVKGGLLANVKGLRGFIPASHVALHYVPDLGEYIGKKLKFKIIEVDKKKNRIILSHKIVMEEEQERKRKETWESIKEGQIIKGKVQRLTDFGAFVDVGGVDGLIHISELSWGVVKEGDEIEVKVLGVDRERGRISLGLKQILPDPWENIEEKYKIGTIITGKVVKLVNFGAFVEVEPGVEGLVHISQISREHIAKPEDVLAVGQEIKAKILDITPEEHKMSLSIREAEGSDYNRKQNETAINSEKNERSGVTIGEMFGDLFEETQKGFQED
ncbi:30S ribosomal protein S1 [Koleobacter methoxysyntrophicus]|uniref:4-hydroxy-3-methylbut-2-enyl diphosphate reductase n=1 Tax=Koleobacter methoxysyntrophicus TaxID=2751313 RepID=A0A8A0RPD3_9FIRM|nr:bifunctional 4-hydroxy-3-methylbut-2-enyl diphosphate reductase/30S ribosomal protein S1 [Koleobacter methoxysyntrophicus]QSQ10123.1 30S ribosomal protein S1 [Koleobacter methoxysyntrophicus]